jgi:hypothetical protein
MSDGKRGRQSNDEVSAFHQLSLSVRRKEGKIQIADAEETMEMTRQRSMNVLLCVSHAHFLF